MRSSTRSLSFRAGVSRTLFAVIASISILGPLSARAAFKSWNGSLNGNWGTAGNWDPAGAPANGDTLSFPALGGGAFFAMTNNLAGRRFESVNFNAGGYTLRGNSIGVTNGLNSFNGAGFNVVFVDLALGAAQTFNNSSPGFTILGGIDLAGFNLTLDAGDAADIINMSGVIGGTGNVTKIGVGFVDFEGAGANTYAGATTVSAGELRLAKTAGTTSVQGNLAIAAGATVTLFNDSQIADTVNVNIGLIGVLDLNGFDDTVGALDLTGATITTGAGTLFLNGDVTNRAATVITTISGNLNLGRFTRTLGVAASALSTELNIPANISGSFSGTIPNLFYAGIIKAGTGRMQLSGTNTYGGPTIINEGSLVAASDTALGATAPVLSASFPGTTVNPAGQLILPAVDIGPEPLILNRAAPAAAVSASGVCSWSGPVTLNSNVLMSASVTLALSNAISGPGGLTLFSASPAAVFRFAGTVANDFDGPLLLSDGTLELAKTGGLVVAAPTGVTIGDPGDSANVKTVRYLNTLQMDGSVTINCSGVLDLNNFSDTITSLTMAGGTVNTGVGTLQVNGNINVGGALSPCDDNVINGRLHFFGVASPRFINMPVGSLALGAPDLTINAIFSGVPEVILSGNSGRVFLNGANTFSGVLRLASTSGDLVVRLNNPSALGATAAGTVLDGVQLELGGFNFTAEPLTNASLGTVIRTIGNNNHGGPIVLDFDLVITNTAAVTELTGVISGPGDMRKKGAGTLRFSGGAGNSFGGMFVEQGTFEMNKAAGFRAASPLFIGGGANTATARHFQANQTDIVQVNFNSLYDLSGDNETLTSLTLHDGGDVTTGAGVLTLAGNVTVTGGTLSFGDTVSGISGNLNLGASGTRTFSVVERSSIVIGSDPTELIVNAVVSGAAALSKTGAGDMSLTAANTFTGTVTVSDGELLISNDDALGTTLGTTIVNGDALLGISGNITVAGESLTLNTRQVVDGAVHNTGGTNTWTGPVSLTQTAFINVSTNTALILSGVISGNGGVTKIGPGALHYAGGGPNTYTGLTRVNEGTLELRKVVVNGAIPGDLTIGDGVGGSLSDVVRLVSVGQIANNSDVTMDTSGLLDLNDVNEGIGTLAGAGRVDLGAAATGGLTLNANASTEYSGMIVGAGLPASALRKLGTGTFTLSGNNTYTGTNLVQLGTVLVNGLQPQSPFVVLSGATLGGNGRIGILDVNNIGNLAPGASPGRLISGPAKLDPGSNFRVEINSRVPISGFDQLSVIGAIDLNGAQLLLTKGPEYVPVDGDMLMIVANDGADAVTGAFGGLAEGAVFSLGGTSFRISYAGGTGNDVTLTVTNIPLRFASTRVEAGNGNGRVDPNECDHLFIALENVTGSSVANISARLDSLTPGVAVTQPDSAYPNIPALGFGTNTTPFQIRVAPNFPCGQNIELSLVVTPSGLARFTVPVTLNSGTPNISFGFTSTNAPKAILDLGTTNSLIIVTNEFLVRKVRVSLHATHPAAGDLRFRLRSPNGTEVLLSANRGGNTANYGNSCAVRTTFDDDAATKITAASAPFAGVFAPEGSLADLIGEDSAGIWRLFVDDTVAGDTGVLQCWSLQLAPAVCGDGGGGCESCLASVSGTLVPGSPTLAERLSRNFVPSGCGNVKPCPGITTGSNPFRFRLHNFTNPGPETCVTVVLNVPCAASANALQSAAYLASFDTSDLCANYLGDSGDSVFDGSVGYTFRVPAGARFVVVVNEVDGTGANQGCGNYTLDLYGLPCPPPTLFIEKVPPDRVRLHWSTAYPEYQLQRSTILNGAPPFINVPGAPFVLDGDYNVTNSATANDDYFRLRRP